MMMPQNAEKLIDDFSHNHRRYDDEQQDDNNNGGLNAFQKRLETLSKEFLSQQTGMLSLQKLMFENQWIFLFFLLKIDTNNDQTINELKNRLNQENIAELFAKLFANHHPIMNQNPNSSNSNSCSISSKNIE